MYFWCEGNKRGVVCEADWLDDGGMDWITGWSPHQTFVFYWLWMSQLGWPAWPPAPRCDRNQPCHYCADKSVILWKQSSQLNSHRELSINCQSFNFNEAQRHLLMDMAVLYSSLSVYHPYLVLRKYHIISYLAHYASNVEIHFLSKRFPSWESLEIL